jgi:hypothetical protein
MTVDVLKAVRWIAEAWETVSKDAIQKCFRKAGILNPELQLVSHSIESDPFADFEADELYADSDELQDMISRMDGIQCCSADEFIQADDQLPVSQHFDEEG